MSTFVFVHGGFHGGWCWAKLASRLKGRGANVFAPDLAGMGADMTPNKEITFQRWVSDVACVVGQQSESVILVGHSLGGFVTSGVAEQCADEIAATVYISAFLPATGASIATSAELIRDRQVRMAQAPRVLSADGLAVRLESGADTKGLFYNTSSDEDISFANRHLSWQPLQPFGDPIPLSDAKYGRVPRIYMECLRDQGLPLEVQREVQAAHRFERVISFDTDHSPFFSATDELADELLNISAAYAD